jgi:hypothetical protein
MIEIIITTGIIIGGFVIVVFCIASSIEANSKKKEM